MTSSHRISTKDKCINETSPRRPEWMAGALFFVSLCSKRTAFDTQRHPVSRCAAVCIRFLFYPNPPIVSQIEYAQIKQLGCVFHNFRSQGVGIIKRRVVINGFYSA